MNGPAQGGIGRPMRQLGRYMLFDEIASGGMATVHIGRMLGPAGFNKTVAIKRLHGHLARDAEFVSMFLDEARLAARIQHPNVVGTLDVVATDGEVFLVLEYIQGESLSHLLKATWMKNSPVALRVVGAVLVNLLHGLHAAHEAVDEYGNVLGIVHRDVSPQNVMVGSDGVARVFDFGVAKATGRVQSTRDGQLKGKIAFMAPEQVRGEVVDRRTDVYSAAAVLWEALTARRLVQGPNEVHALATVLQGNFPAPRSVNPALPPRVDALVMRGLSLNPDERYPTARDFARAVEHTLGVASPFEVSEWVQTVGAEALAMRAARVREVESTSAVRVSQGRDGEPGVVVAPASGPREISSTRIQPIFVDVPPANALRVPGAPPAGAPPSPPLAARVAVASVIVATLLGGAAGAWFLLRPSSDADGAATPAPVASEQSAVPAVTATAVPPPATQTAAAAAAPVVTTGVVPPAARAPDRPPPALPTATARPGAAPGPKPAPSSKNCDSPFYVDSNGIKQIKPECM